MQNLRDKLLKAGLVTEKQVKESEQKKKPAPRPPPKAPKELSLEEQQRREAFAAREAELAEERRKEAAKVAEARMQSERARTIRALVAEHRVKETGYEPFHWVRRNGKIGKILVSEETAKQLQAGTAAVVEDPGQPDPAVVPSGAAQRIYKIDPKAIRFWAGPEKPIGFEESAGDEDDAAQA